MTDRTVSVPDSVISFYVIFKRKNDSMLNY